MGCGSWCVYYADRGVSGACVGCAYYFEERRSRFELGKVDIFKLARLLRERAASGNSTDSREPRKKEESHAAPRSSEEHMDNREADQHPHPPSCTCVACTEAYLKRHGYEAPPKAPKPKRQPLWVGKTDAPQPTTTPEASPPAPADTPPSEKADSTRNVELPAPDTELSRHFCDGYVPDTDVSPSLANSRVAKPPGDTLPTHPQETPKQSEPPITARRPDTIPTWLIAILFVFGLAISGLGISLFSGTTVPFWVLCAFSVIFSAEKWFRPWLKHRSVGMLYKLVLNLSLLATLWLVIWSGIELFAQRFAQSPTVGSLVFLGEFVFLVWLWRVVAQNRWRTPSMGTTLLVLIAVTVVFAFSGVQPLSAYKDTAAEKWSVYWTAQEARREVNLAQAELDRQRKAEEQRRALEKPTVVAPPIPTPPPVSPHLAAASQLPLSSQSPTIMDKASRAVKDFSLWNTDTSDYAARFNQYRQSQSRAALTFTSDLNRLATLRLSEIKTDFSHNSRGRYNNHLAENIVKGVYSNQDALSSWQGSPGHKANMLDATYRYTGYAAGDGHAIQLFSQWNTVSGVPQLPQGYRFSD